MAENRVVDDVIVKMFTMTSTAKGYTTKTLRLQMLLQCSYIRLVLPTSFASFFLEKAKNLGCSDDAKRRRKGGDGLTAETFHHLLFIFLVFGSSSASCIGNKEIHVIFHLPLI